jgi:hypothetical protein
MIRSITPIFSTLLAVLIFFFVIQPKYEEAKAVRVETDQYNTAATQYTVFNAEVQERLLKRDNIKTADRNRLDLLVPESLDDTRMLVDIDAIARESGVIITNIQTTNDDVDASSLVSKNTQTSNPGTVPVNDELRTSDITLDVMGEYDAFKKFLQGIETSLSIMHVVEMTFSKSDGDFNIFTVTLRTYALPDSTYNN